MLYEVITRELNKGKLNGMLVTKANKLYPEYEDLNDINLVYPNGESMITFYERIKGDVDKILALDNSLIVTHRGVINMLYFILNNMEPNRNNFVQHTLYEVIRNGNVDGALRMVKQRNAKDGLLKAVRERQEGFV